jgi:phosphoribosylanthranilate isomerase
MNKLKIKVCGMRDVLNIGEIAMLSPDYMGFIFYNNSPRCAGKLNPVVLNMLTPETFAVGVFVNTPVNNVIEIAERYRFSVLQLHGDEKPEYCAELKSKYKCKIIKAFGIKSEEDFAVTGDYEETCDYFLFDTKTVLYGGSGKKFDHSLLVHYNSKKPFFLSGGITVHDVENISNSRHESCIGIDVNSGFEISPGVKNRDQIKKILDFIRQTPDEQNI